MDELLNEIGQLFVIGFDGLTLPDDAKRLLGDQQAGGAILFKRNIDSLEQVVALNREIFACGDEDRPAVISVDQEGGRVARLRGICTDVPPMRVVGNAAVDDPDLPYRLGAMMARELSALGFHWNFAPVLDVDTNPDNPVIGERAFATTANGVCHHAIQFLRGLQQAGIAGSGKHFPGHGDTDTDSHLTLPVLRHGRARLDRIELPPFAAAIEAGVASIMTAHVLFPEVDGTYPATLSPAILDGILRQELGYDGLVVSDDLEMKALHGRFPIAEIVERGLMAGVDCFLVCRDTQLAQAAMDAARDGVAAGRIPESRVRTALARMREFKETYVGAAAPAELEEAQSLVRAGPHLQLAAPLLGRSDDVGARPDSQVDVT